MAVRTNNFNLAWTDLVKEGDRLFQKVEQIKEEPPTERTARMLEFYANRLLVNDCMKRQVSDRSCCEGRRDLQLRRRQADGRKRPFVSRSQAGRRTRPFVSLKVTPTSNSLLTRASF